MKRPSPALVISCVALFVSLGGSGYAATQLHFASDAKARSKHKAAPKFVTAKEVNKLIASYVSSHHLGATGPTGAAGAHGPSGNEGKPGPQGPGAQRIEVDQIGEVSKATIAKVGLWTLTLDCTGSGSTFTIAGPGFFRYTESSGVTGEPAGTSSEDVTANGFASNIGNERQQDIAGFLVSGATMEQLSLELGASSGVPFETCTVTGDAIPAS